MSIVHLLQILVLALIQGAAEMLPISSTAHVTVAARLMNFDHGTDSQWAFLLIMLHTGTMLAVLVYFRARWKLLWKQVPALAVATLATLAVGYVLKELIKHFFLRGAAGKQPQEIEHLFLQLPLIAAALAAAGIVILVAGLKDRKSPGRRSDIGLWPATVVGIVQGLALPFRGFSRSGSTISTGMFFGIDRIRAEEFSFALAVLLTPVVIVYEARQIVGHAAAVSDPQHGLVPLVLASLAGMVFSFLAGLLALRWLSRWLERGRWQWFGGYCLVAAVAVLAIHFAMP
ncbi:MAG TPA: undecaprenyl-diphosphate phosphatase [Pirellulales bacterium]|nr:undecaprenyl-diphosphate phosphatase [Pirellulales bacterium]